MIKLREYSEDFKEEYWEGVVKVLDKDIQERIKNSSGKFLPKDFYVGSSPDLKELVLAPFEKLKKAEAHIRAVSENVMDKECFLETGRALKHPYLELFEAFGKVADGKKKKFSMRVRIVKQADLTVCPYCNRDYINCRAEHVSGAQLDHFFSRSKYPIFAVSLYNLVPVCANCNRVKSAQKEKFASPFDETIDWEKEITFTYQMESMEHGRIGIKSENQAVRNNLEAMRIEEAYQIHDLEAEELLKKCQAYSRSQQKEIREVLRDAEISDDEIKQVIFGPKISEEDRKKKPLGKFLHDLQKEWEVWEDHG